MSNTSFIRKRNSSPTIMKRINCLLAILTIGAPLILAEESMDKMWGERTVQAGVENV